MKVTKEFNWGMSHRLENHTGLCNNVHGHNYKLFVTVAQVEEAEEYEEAEPTNVGMVIDFKDLKHIVKTEVVDLMDHAFMYNGDDESSVKIAEFLKKEIGQKTLAVDWRITAENMARWIYGVLNMGLEEYGCEVSKIKLYETDTSYAEYEEY